MDLAKYIKLNCKKMDKAEGEEIAKIIKNIETDEDDKGVELTLDEISINQKDVTKINLYDIKDYHTSEVGEFFRLRIGKYRAIFKIDKNIITILVLDIGSHGSIYKK